MDIELTGLTKRYGEVTAVDGLTARLTPGQITAFLGPNGAGKTTTLRLLLGLIRPDAGEARFGGRPYHRLPSPRRTVGAVLGPDGFHRGRTGRDHLRVVATAARLPAARIDEVLDVVELTPAADRRVGGYSLGMRQRLGLACALLGDPEILIADEPANGLDPEGIAWLRGLFRTAADQGRTVLISSHFLAEVTRTADRVLVVDHGRLRFDGSLADLAGLARTARAGDSDGGGGGAGVDVGVGDGGAVGVGEAADVEDAFLRLTSGVEA